MMYGGPLQWPANHLTDHLRKRGGTCAGGLDEGSVQYAGAVETTGAASHLSRGGHSPGGHDLRGTKIHNEGIEPGEWRRIGEIGSYVNAI